MRRLLFIFLLAVLPLQWSWAAIGNACAHESGPQAHFGHHAHQHQDSTPDDPADDASPGTHHDCSTCQALSAAFPARVTLTTSLPSSVGFAAYCSAVAERTPDTLLRPPHLHAG